MREKTAKNLDTQMINFVTVPLNMYDSSPITCIIPPSDSLPPPSNPGTTLDQNKYKKDSPGFENGCVSFGGHLVAPVWAAGADMGNSPNGLGPPGILLRTCYQYQAETLSTISIPNIWPSAVTGEVPFQGVQLIPQVTSYVNKNILEFYPYGVPAGSTVLGALPDIQRTLTDPAVTPIVTPFGSIPRPLEGLLQPIGTATAVTLLPDSPAAPYLSGVGNSTAWRGLRPQSGQDQSLNVVWSTSTDINQLFIHPAIENINYIGVQEIPDLTSPNKIRYCSKFFMALWAESWARYKWHCRFYVGSFAES